MASEDVIELGSSDEDAAEPAPKRVKPRPNAMVHIPSKLSRSGISMKPANSRPGVSIKPVKHDLNPVNKLIGKGVTVTKIKNANQVPNVKRNGTSNVASPPFIRNQSGPSHKNKLPVQKAVNITVNPFSVLNNLNPQIIKVASGAKVLKHPVIVQGRKPISSLPPSVTITKTTAGKKRVAPSTIANVKKKKKVLPNACEILTVELDDDEVPESSTSSPQWYIRPEEQTSNEGSKKSPQQDPLTSNQDSELEAKNNAEPEPSKFIEITIEDSPIKPVQNKRTHEVGAELAITIDDSPVKAAAVRTASVDSDDEGKPDNTKDKHSKKKLNYPKEPDAASVIEIEIDPMEIEPYQEPKSDERVEKIKDIIEIQESPVKKAKTSETTPEKAVKDVQLKSKQDTIPEHSKPGEFHPLYQEFIDLCFKLENSSDMQTIVEKKIKGYYRQVPKEYTESEEFTELVQSKLFAMKASPEKLYLYIKDIVDELNLQRKMAKSRPVVKETKNIEAERFQYGEDSEFDSKRQRQIRKLEKTLKKLHRAIQKLEEQEVDFDDEEDSVYLLTERYKERMVRVHAKFCQLTNTKMPSEPHIQIEPRPGRPLGPAKRLEKWVNKKVPIGKPRPFPDFHDVLRCVRDANDEDHLGWNEADVMEEARDLFTRCGKKLQRRRQENEWRLAASRISSEVDPAEVSDDLKRKLETNKQLADKKETDVFDKFADKQNLLKLEAVEIGDKEADESPVESEEENEGEVVEEGGGDSPLGNKEKRKERLRRLIQEKSKKNAEEQENKPKKDEDDNNKTADITVNDAGSRQMEVESGIENENEECKMDDTVKDSTNDIESISKEKTDSNSDDSKVDSDVDELHLLQKLHSDEFNSTTNSSSDTDSPIDISDSLSSGDNRGKINSDVISIENSSYSESESKDGTVKDDKMNVVNKEKNTGEVEYSSAGIQLNEANKTKQNKESCESILLASSDDSQEDRDGCVNLKDDAISIGDTIIQENHNKNDTELIEESVTDSLTETENLKTINVSSVESCINSVGSDSMENDKPPNEIEQQENGTKNTEAAHTDTGVQSSTLSKEVIPANDLPIASNSKEAVELNNLETSEVSTSKDSDVNDNEVANIENDDRDNLDQLMQDIHSTETQTSKDVSIDEKNIDSSSQDKSEVIHEINTESPITKEAEIEHNDVEKEKIVGEKGSASKKDDSADCNDIEETKSLEAMIKELQSDLDGNILNNTT